MMTKEELLDEMRESKGEEYVENNRDLIVTQARLVGEIPHEGEQIDDDEGDNDEDTE